MNQLTLTVDLTSAEGRRLLRIIQEQFPVSEMESPKPAPKAEKPAPKAEKPAPKAEKPAPKAEKLVDFLEATTAMVQKLIAADNPDRQKNQKKLIKLTAKFVPDGKPVKLSYVPADKLGEFHDELLSL